MSLSMYQASIPVLQRALRNLAAIIDKAQAHAAGKKIDEAAFIQARLFPDMFPFARQVMIATDMAKGCAARLAGQEPPKYEDDETSFAELKARIEKTVVFLDGFSADQIDGSEEKVITLPSRNGTRTFNGQTYLLGFVLPNVYFHVTTAYNLLRHGGVEIGKQDFIGQL
mgnify:CR=1 FL=1